MAKKPTITTLTSGFNSTTTLNNNFTALRNAFDNTLSLDGSTPNAMNADLDMNSNDILNVGEIDVQGLTIDGVAVYPGSTQLATTYATQSYTGNGSTTVYSMGFNPGVKANVNVYIDGVHQNQDAFSISGTSLTFTAAPPLNSAIEIKVPINVTSLVNTNSSQLVYNQGGTGAQDRSVQSRLRDFVSVKDFGAVGDGVTDDTAALIAAMDALSDGDTLDLNGLHLNIFVGVAGVTTGDAIALSGVPRLYNKSNITIKNGKITADSPSVSGTKYRYPTTLTIDGCTNIILEDLILHSKGESWGDTDASVGLTKEQRRAFAAQNGGHALLIVRSLGTKVINCQTRLCGSVGPLYVMSSHDTNITNTFSNAGSLGYAAFCFDSWAGDISVSGFPAHCSTMTDCSSHKETYTYGSKGCVLTEDGDVTVTVNGGFFADAYPNGSARDIGYAFGCSSSQTIVNSAVVKNCANIGYTGTTNNTDYSYLYVSNVHATGLRKTVHQNEDTSVGRMYWKYTDVTANVVGGGEWVGDGDLTREQTSYVAMPNDANRIRGSFTQCTFTGATYCFINTSQIFGSLRFNECDIETNGFLWSSKGIGSGSSGDKFNRAVVFEKCAIEDISSETTAYTNWVSTTVYVYVDVSTSTITLNSVRDIESSVIATPATFIDLYKFPQEEANIETISASPALKADSAKQQVLSPSGTDRKVLLPRPDKYKYIEFKIINSAAALNLVVRDYADTTTLVTLAPSEACTAFNDGATDYAFKL